MKKLSLLLVAFFLSAISIAQSPQKMSYQCVVRNASGNLVTNHTVGIKISIHQGSATGVIVFSETYNPVPQTNANGLVTVEIGSGTASAGSFAEIDWSAGPYFLETQTDPTGGINYTISGTSQLLSVPYALYAKSAGNGFSGNYNDLTNRPILFSGNYNDLTNRPTLFDGTWTSLSGKPTTLSGYGITDADPSITNEIQKLSLSGSVLTLSNNGGSVALPSSSTGDYVTLTGNQTIGGVKTFSNDILVNNLTVGLGGGAREENTALGAGALILNIDGEFNTAIGLASLYTNTGGHYNTAVGAYSLDFCTTGSANTAVGTQALYSNTTGYGNTTVGNQSLQNNITGYYNSSMGDHALISNNSGAFNTAVGYQALWYNSAGNNNTAMGTNSGSGLIEGNNNTLLGAYADVVFGGYSLSNATAIGYEAAVSASNKVRIGNNSVTVIEGNVNYSVGSDIRLKDDVIYSNKLGLSFINKLRTVTFTYKNDPNKRRHDGLIAQDVKEALDQLGIEFSGLTENDNQEKILNLSYSEFVIPLINAVKDQQEQIDELKKEIELLKSK